MDTDSGERRWQDKHMEVKINYIYWNDSQRAEVRETREAGVERGEGEAEAGPRDDLGSSS